MNTSRLLWVLLATLPAVMIARGYFAVTDQLGYDAILWTTVFILAVTAAFHALRSLAEPGADLSAVRVALGVGAAAFLLHDMINFALYQPATAAVFWLALGAAAGASLSSRGGTDEQHGADRGHSATQAAARPAGMLIVAAVLAAGFAAVLVFQWAPVFVRTQRTDEMLRARQAYRVQSALSLAEQAAEADPLDPVSAADAARLYAPLAALPDASPEAVLKARHWANAAVERDPQHARVYLQRAAILGEDPAALDDWRRALELDPQNARARIDFAQRLPWSDPRTLQEAFDQLDRARRINDLLFADSNLRLSARERAEMDKLQGAAAFAAAAARRGDTKLLMRVADTVADSHPRQSRQLRALAASMTTTTTPTTR